MMSVGFSGKILSALALAATLSACSSDSGFSPRSLVSGGPDPKTAQETLERFAVVAVCPEVQVRDGTQICFHEHDRELCRAATGASVSRHIETARMTEARRLLAFTRLPVAEIGYRLGFSDPPYFSRRFRAVTGETPSDYRERFAG